MADYLIIDRFVLIISLDLTNSFRCDQSNCLEKFRKSLKNNIFIGHKHKVRCFKRGLDPCAAMITPTSTPPSTAPSECSAPR